MKMLTHLFSSAAKFEILGLLCQRSSPLPLRHISYLTGLPIRSTELAVASLRKQKVLRRKKVGKQVLVSFNDLHESALLLSEIFAVVNKHLMPPQPNLDKKARQVLDFIDSANNLFHGVLPR
jgi:hypothetical protein